MQIRAPTQVFILQCWQARQQDGVHWYFRLEILPHGEARVFPNLEALKAFLEQYLTRLESGTLTSP